MAKSGDVVTNVGKKIALSAHLIPPGDKHHTDYSYGGGHFSKYFGSSSGHSSSGNNDHHEEGKKSKNTFMKSIQSTTRRYYTPEKNNWIHNKKDPFNFIKCQSLSEIKQNIIFLFKHSI